MKEHYINLFNYNRWANQKCYESINTVNPIDDKTVSLFSHILASQKIWLSRINKYGDNPISPWEKFPLEKLQLINNEISDQWMEFIVSISAEKFSERIFYKNSLGKEFNYIVSDILTHVINHSTYHRGQIALLIRTAGGTPAVTDYIFYKRQ